MPQAVSEVKTLEVAGKSGFSVAITDDSGKAMVTFAFRSQETAEKARQRLGKIVQRSLVMAGD